MKRYTLTVLLIGVLLAAACPAIAQSAADSTAAHPPDEGGYLPAETSGPAYLSILDVAGKLIVAVVIAYGLLYAIRWWRDNRLQAGTQAPSRERRMTLEETLALGPDGHLYLVEVEGQRMLLAARQDGLERVAELTDEGPRPSAYRSVRQRTDGSTDELNVVQGRTSTRAVRPDLTDDGEEWKERRNRLLAELQEQD